MPLKIYFLISLVSLSGTLVAAFLLAHWYEAWKSGERSRIFKNTLSVFLFVVLGLVLSTLFIPCFSLTTNVVCHGPKNEKWIALTFDDGPNEPYTSQILDILDREHVPATFFPLGKNSRLYPQVIRRMAETGYVIGNHSWDHRSMVWMGPEEVLNEIEGWEKSIDISYQPGLRLFRSPHGWKNPFMESQLKKKGYHLIGWSRGVWDSDQPGEEVLLQRLLKKPTNGEMILLHDGEDIKVGADRRQTVAILPALIHEYRRQGFQFVTIPQILERQATP